MAGDDASVTSSGDFLLSPTLFATTGLELDSLILLDGTRLDDDAMIPPPNDSFNACAAARFSSVFI